jgi:hypothetical protein
MEASAIPQIYVNSMLENSVIIFHTLH